mmetsp:Transcript_96205/g.220568  ORF Transcript_96205/g.220568 Transcript_96205/m.220568 type:complete len:204 (-) Transcript_96205:620-1231(-)
MGGVGSAKLSIPSQGRAWAAFSRICWGWNTFWQIWNRHGAVVGWGFLDFPLMFTGGTLGLPSPSGSGDGGSSGDRRPSGCEGISTETKAEARRWWDRLSHVRGTWMPTQPVNALTTGISKNRPCSTLCRNPFSRALVRISGQIWVGSEDTGNRGAWGAAGTPVAPTGTGSSTVTCLHPPSINSFTMYFPFALYRGRPVSGAWG